MERGSLLIASPPCQAWSMAGQRKGEQDIARVHALTADLVAGRTPEPSVWADPRSRLVTEPIRWIKALRPTLVALEQVPPVLDYWHVVAGYLREWGYSTWTGVISSEYFGVPQTRKRAILMASLVGPVHPPQPTHQEYRSGEPAWDHPQMTLEGELLPWVSMAQALGWDGTGVVNTRADRQTPGGNEFPPSQPSFRANAQENSATRDGDEPAPTITGGHDTGDRVWLDRRQGGAPPRSQDEPAHTQSSQGLAKGRDVWTTERPATTVNGDPRIARPGHKGSGDERDPSPGQMIDAVRVTVEEASILQSFPPDYPWRGSRTAQFQQIGNAVPPLLARAILSALTEGHEVTEAIDLFAGPGGWECGARELGIDPLGIELDDAACRTREAAGLRTLQADVSATDPRSVEPAKEAK